MAHEFVDDDAGYRRWLGGHPSGFVVNSFRTPTPAYMMLHRSTCVTISGVPARGSRWTTGDYIKVCAERRADLERWARERAGGTLTPCGLCQP